MKIITSEFDGKKITYSSETNFIVQDGKGKGSYKTRYSFKGNLSQAVFYYNAINIRAPYKKRLLMMPAKKSVLARQIGG